jgi:hypothetical protein
LERTDVTPDRLVAAVLIATLLGVAVAEAAGQIATDFAVALANRIGARAFVGPGAKITSVSAASHDNFVEIRNVVSDSVYISRLRSRGQQVRSLIASHYCIEGLIPFLEQGLVIHQTFAAADNRDQIAFTLDSSSCVGRRR